MLRRYACKNSEARGSSNRAIRLHRRGPPSNWRRVVSLGAQKLGCRREKTTTRVSRYAMSKIGAKDRLNDHLCLSCGAVR